VNERLKEKRKAYNNEVSSTVKIIVSAQENIQIPLALDEQKEVIGRRIYQ
jgi:hypothetical protein